MDIIETNIYHSYPLYFETDLYHVYSSYILDDVETNFVLYFVYVFFLFLSL